MFGKNEAANLFETCSLSQIFWREKVSFSLNIYLFFNILEGKSYQWPLSFSFNIFLQFFENFLKEKVISGLSSRWTPCFLHFSSCTGISQIGGAGPGNYGKYLIKKTGKYERCFLNSSQLSFVIFSSRLSGWSSDKYSHRPQSLISLLHHHK